MAKDVEFNVTASDRTGDALRRVEDNFRRSNERISKDREKEFTSSLDRIVKVSGGKLGPALSSKLAGDLTASGGLAKFESAFAKISSLAGGVLSPKLIASISEGLAGAGPAIAPVLAGVALAAAPTIAATLEAAVIGGAGIGGVIGGVLLASRDARVQAAGKDLGRSILGSLEQDSTPFVAPLLAGIDTVKARFVEVEGDIRSIFARSATFVAPLVDGITRAVQAITRGLNGAIGGAGPVIDVIARHIAVIGDQLGDFLDHLGKDGPAAAVALEGALQLVEATLEPILASVEALTDAFGLAAKLGLLGPQAQRDMLVYEAQAKITAATVGNLGDKFREASDTTDQFGNAITTAGAPVGDMAQNLRDAATAAGDLYSSFTDAAQAVADASQQIKQNGKTLDVNTQKGRDNRKALSDVASALRNNYEQYVAVNGAGAGAAAQAENLRGQFIALATKATGSARAARDLADQILGIPGSKDVRLTANTHDAAGRLAALQDQINGIKGKTVTITITSRVAGSQTKAVLGRLGPQLNNAAGDGWYAAAGGSVARTQAPTQVDVASTVNVSLDGQPFRAMSVAAASQVQDRAAWRQKVGKR